MKNLGPSYCFKRNKKKKLNKEQFSYLEKVEKKNAMKIHVISKRKYSYS